MKMYIKKKGCTLNHSYRFIFFFIEKGKQRNLYRKSFYITITNCIEIEHRGSHSFQDSHLPILVMAETRSKVDSVVECNVVTVSAR